MAIQIIPQNDSSEHEHESTCACNPKVFFENGIMIISHYAFDERHLIEEVFKDENKKWKVIVDE